jgi:hypothetical protein
MGEVGDLELASSVAEVGAALGLVGFDDAVRQRLMKAANFGLEAAILVDDNFAEPASAKLDLTLG